MSTSLLVIEGLIGLIEEQPELFSAGDRAELEQQLFTLPDSIDDMARSLVKWSSARPAIFAVLKSRTSQEARGQSNAVGLDGTKYPQDRFPTKTPPPPKKSEDYKQMLLNAFHRSKPSSPGS